MNSLKNLAPANGQNAILNAAFAVDLDGGREEMFIASFSALAPALVQKGYGPALPVQAITMSLSNQEGIGMVPAQTSSLVGYSYVKKNTAGQITREFVLRENSLTIVIQEYSRWQVIWAEVHELLLLFAPLLAMTKKSVRSVALQYTDKFTWREPGKPFPIGQVLRAAPQYAADALNQVGSWHSNYGHFVNTDISWARKRLDNVNFVMDEESGCFALTILTLHRYLAKENAKEPPEFVKLTIPELFKEAHDENKRLIKSFLTEEVCDLINMT